MVTARKGSSGADVEPSAPSRSKLMAIAGPKERAANLAALSSNVCIEPKSDEPQRNLVAAAIGHEANAGKAQDHHGPG